jgi:iron complex transport system permease protein
MTVSRALPPQRLPISGRVAGLAMLVALACFIAVLSLRFGSLRVGWGDAWNALVHYDPATASTNELVVRGLRLPRTVIALAVGGGLAVAGATMQSVTRNPLADPSILGISGGASFAVVAAIYYGGITSPLGYVWFAFAGAFGAALLVSAVASTGPAGPTPVKLALAGVVIAFLLGAWTSALLLLDRQTLDTARLWLAGSVAGRDLGTFWVVSPFLLGGTATALLLGHQLNVLSLGEDEARALGMNTARTRLICSLVVVIITGAAVAAAGPIAFVGLATPHIVRSIIGPDARWVLPYALVTGATLLTAADILARLIVSPGELQVGVVTALLGAPVLIALARRTAAG